MNLQQLQQRFPGAREFDLREIVTLEERIAIIQRTLERVAMIHDPAVRLEAAALLNQLDGWIVDAVSELSGRTAAVPAVTPGRKRPS
jgi:hypothetical protein